MISNASCIGTLEDFRVSFCSMLLLHDTLACVFKCTWYAHMSLSTYPILFIAHSCLVWMALFASWLVVADSFVNVRT